jgi:hypothetical protein
MPRVRGPSQLPSTWSLPLIKKQISFFFAFLFFIDYLNPLFSPQSMVDPKQPIGNVYSHHPMLISSQNGSIMNGYPLQPQQ